jgi:hypothetical protein
VVEREAGSGEPKLAREAGDAKWQEMLARAAKVKQDAAAYAEAGKPAKFSCWRAPSLGGCASKTIHNCIEKRHIVARLSAAHSDDLIRSEV